MTEPIIQLFNISIVPRFGKNTHDRWNYRRCNYHSGSARNSFLVQKIRKEVSCGRTDYTTI